MLPKGYHKEGKKLLVDITQLPFSPWEREDAQPNRTKNLLASAANGSNRGCCCGGTWRFGASPAQEAQGEQPGTLARAAAPASR